MKTKTQELDVKFEEVSYDCDCGHTIKEIIPVANNIGILDAKCENCGKRVVNLQFFEDEKERV